ncbi:MAG: hypothetical protein ABL891_10995 [Burkholderiales bacterium]
MKWIVGGLLLAVVGVVYKRPELMMWVVYCFAGLFASMAFALFFAFSRSKHYGLLLLGCTYLSGAVLSVVLTEWWPLVVGFAMAWVLRAMGMDPVADEAKAEPAAQDGEKKS